MTFENDEEAIKYVKEHSKKAPKHIEKGREEARELFALVEGDGFEDELINKIEHIESEEKQLARKKYSRSIVDLYERISQPISNVFSSTGGSVTYNIKNESLRNDYLIKLGNIRDNKSVTKYVQDVWMPLYHTDPNGVIFMEYKTMEKHGEDKVYPTYKSIHKIRSYVAHGQNVDVILFEPKEHRFLVSNTEQLQRIWRLVDDKKEYYIIERGDAFILDEELSFEHPFGKVPALVNSDIVKLGELEYRISPYHKIKALTKEYARDQSIKTLYKFLQGFPIHWRYVVQCRTCQGSGKKGDGTGGCSDCDSKGYYHKKDVTDLVTLTVPESKEDVKLAPDIAGYINPSIETWERYDKELEMLEFLSMETHWGTHKEKSKQETATEVYVDVQPVMNRLDRYADTAEYVINWINNKVWAYMNGGSTEKVSLYNLGRRYIIETPDVILEKYQLSKEKGDNSVILDRLYNEFITSKHKNDPEGLRVELLKSEVEPYLHNSIEQVSLVFGKKEAMRKAKFHEWWQTLDKMVVLSKNSETLKSDFENWFNSLKLEITVPEVPEI